MALKFILLAGMVFSISRQDLHAQHFPGLGVRNSSGEQVHQVQRLGSDSLSSGFLITIPDKVENHRHAAHSEHVYILEGTGIMRLNSDTFKVKAGDYIFIPRNSVHGLKVESGKTMKVISVQAPFFDGSDRIPE